MRFRMSGELGKDRPPELGLPVILETGRGIDQAQEKIHAFTVGLF